MTHYLNCSILPDEAGDEMLVSVSLVPHADPVLTLSTKDTRTFIQELERTLGLAERESMLLRRKRASTLNAHDVARDLESIERKGIRRAKKGKSLSRGQASKLFERALYDYSQLTKLGREVFDELEKLRPELEKPQEPQT